MWLNCDCTKINCICWYICIYSARWYVQSPFLRVCVDVIFKQQFWAVVRRQGRKSRTRGETGCGWCWYSRGAEQPGRLLNLLILRTKSCRICWKPSDVCTIHTPRLRSSRGETQSRQVVMNLVEPGVIRVTPAFTITCSFSGATKSKRDSKRETETDGEIISVYRFPLKRVGSQLKPAKELKMREVKENERVWRVGGGGVGRDVRRFSLVSRAPPIIQVTAAGSHRRAEQPESSSALFWIWWSCWTAGGQRRCWPRSQQMGRLTWWNQDFEFLRKIVKNSLNYSKPPEGKHGGLCRCLKAQNQRLHIPWI